jgi:hypothetical protein
VIEEAIERKLDFANVFGKRVGVKQARKPFPTHDPIERRRPIDPAEGRRGSQIDATSTQGADAGP